MDSKPQLVSDLSLEELLQHAEDGVELPHHKLHLNDVQDFVAANKIKAGEQVVSPDVIFGLYKTWSKKPVSKSRFVKELEILLPREDNKFFLIDKSTFVLLDKIKRLTPEGPKHKSGQKFRDHVQYFFTVNNIVKGDFYIPGKVLYSMYQSWCKKNNYKIRFKYDEFAQVTQLYLPYKWTLHNDYFKVSTTIFKYMSRRQLEQLQDEQKKAKSPV